MVLCFTDFFFSYVLHRFSHCYAISLILWLFCLVHYINILAHFQKNGQFVLQTETAGKIEKFLIRLFTASVLLLQSVFFHGSLKSRHGKRKLLSVSHIFGTSLKLAFVWNCLYFFTASLIAFPALSGYVFPFRKDSAMPHYSCCSLSTLSNSVLSPLLSCFGKVNTSEKWGLQMLHFLWWLLICAIVT